MFKIEDLEFKQNNTSHVPLIINIQKTLYKDLKVQILEESFHSFQMYQIVNIWRYNAIKTFPS